jgi:hypothetical protein
LKYVRQCPWNDTSIRVSLSPTRNSERLSRPSLAVCKDGAVVALDTIINHIFCDSVEHGLLLRKHIKNTIILELIVIIFNLVVPEAFSLEIEFNFALFWIQADTLEWFLGWPHPQVDFNACFLRHYLI